MQIANPIYDSAFKYLMKDEKIARYFLSTLLNREIAVEEFLQTEESQVFQHAPTGFIMQRMDFQAIIIDENGHQRKVTIELQKSLMPDDIVRFRKYLASCYHDPSLKKTEQDEQELIFIYIAGFNLNIPVAAVRTSTQLIDISTQQLIDANTDDDEFMRMLHHESVFVNVNKLSPKMQGRSDRLLSIFNQKYAQANDKKIIELPEESITGLTNDGGLEVAKRLHDALAEYDVREKMLAQEQFQNSIDKLLKKAENEKEYNIGLGKELGKLEGKIEGKIEGLVEGERKGKLEVAKKMLVSGLSNEQVATFTGLSIEEIERI